MDDNNLNNLRHSAAHLLAAAVLRIWPDTKLTIGPAIESGFYYDFDFKEPISDTDLPKIEKMMVKTLTDWSTFTHREVSEDEAREYYKDNPYKLELIDEIVSKGEKITFYKAGYFEDLCRGGHSENPKKDIGAFKLLSIAGAYWRGNEKNPMLTRIYATAFPTQKELDEYLTMLEEARRRDHKKIGKELELFTFHETSPGMTYWLPKGVTLYNELYSFARSMYKKYGYTEVMTPQLNKKELYETSGHWSHYKDDMFVADMARLDSTGARQGEHEAFGIKPMNCPNAMVIFKSKTRSYNDLPLRLGDTSLLHRYERSGTLNGLFRTRQFRQDDAHIFITNEQISEEFTQIMRMIEDMYAPFNLSYRLRFGTRPDKFMGEEKDWDMAENALERILKESGKEYFKADGEGAFYGPKVDILMKDAIGREWQTGTIQLDFQQPKNFELKYTDSDGTEKMPVVFHRAIYGSLERFLGVLIEHYVGALPIWLAPIQVSVLPISDKVSQYANTVFEKINESGVRVELDNSNQTIGAKIREATLQKVPYLSIIGEKEESESNRVGKEIISVRTRDGQDLGNLELSEFSERLKKEIEKKT
jgi:threonyl-tRNA synthetase